MKKQNRKIETEVSYELKEGTIYDSNTGMNRVERKTGQVFWEGKSLSKLDVSGRKIKIISGWQYYVDEDMRHAERTEVKTYSTWDYVDLDTGHSLGFRFQSVDEAQSYIFNNDLEKILREFKS